MARSGWLVAVASAVSGAILLGLLVHPVVGSGRTCEGIGFGCTPERDLDTLLIVAVYVVAVVGTLLVAWWCSRRGRGWRKALMAGIVITVVMTAATAWSQLPRYRVAPGSLSASSDGWERVFADGEAVAPPGTPLGDALRRLDRRGPLTCRDAYGRSTGAHELRWANRDPGDAYLGKSDRSGAATAAALGAWAERLRARGIAVNLDDPSGDPSSDRRLQAGGSGPTGGGVLTVRASWYISELEITATTGCHRG
jgi:MFS family permease